MIKSLLLLVKLYIAFLIFVPGALCESTEEKTQSPPPRAKDAEKIIGHLFNGYQILHNTVIRLRSIVCNTSVGRIPGKLTEENKAYFSYNKREYVCHNYEVLEGRRIPDTGELPEECNGKGYDTGDDRIIYPVVVYNKHGEIPGKAYEGVDRKYGYYGLDKGQYRRRRFDWFC